MTRLPDGGRIDRSRPLSFTFDGVPRSGYEGDTLASALLANGVRVVARSVHDGRPRGIVACGAEEPSAFVRLVTHGTSEPMLPATQIELYDGLEAFGLAGKGRVPPEADPARYDKRHAHCDVLVVGGGPAGAGAACAAARTGARVLLLDEQPELGGGLLATRLVAGLTWIEETARALGSFPETRVLTRTTALGLYDGNTALALERRTDHLGPGAPPRVSRQRLWQLRARRVVLATGALERPIVFADNDRPGVMLAGAARAYVNRYAVRPGSRAVVFATNDSGRDAARDLADAGVEVAALVDPREERAVVGTEAGPDGSLAAVAIGTLDGRALETLECDLLAVSGGWNPAVHLHAQSQGRLRYDETAACFVPEPDGRPRVSIGAAAGALGLGACVQAGLAAGAQAALAAGFGDGQPPAAPELGGEAPAPPRPLWLVPSPDGDRSRHYVDLARDATVSELERALGAGLRSVEHVKRYTSIGTGPDQGATGGVAAVAVAAELLGETPGTLGTTTHRPPYRPVAFGALAGRNRGALSDPVRVTPIHSWHVAHGAVFEDVGQWKRPRAYPRPGEDLEAAVLRECAAARGSVALMDASTLGKIELRGRDSVELLNRLYTNAYSSLAVGSCRYGVLCATDGMILDDGVVMRLGEERFIATTTTGNAAVVLDWMEEWLQTEWPGLDVHLTSVTEQWATVALVGPASREVLARLTDIPLANGRFPFMTIREGEVAGIPARVCRVSFSGELAFEVNVAGWHGLAVWEALVAAGEPLGIVPYGTDAMHVLRAEKGYVIVGQDTDGTVTPGDAGMDWIVSWKKPDFLGRRSLLRADTSRPDRKQLVALLPADPGLLLPEGGQIVLSPDPPLASAGHVTSSYRSAALGRTFALALLAAGRERIGTTVHVPLDDRLAAAEVAAPVLYDPEGARRDG